MPSKNMLPKGRRHHSVRSEYVATRGVEPEAPAAVPVLAFDAEEMLEQAPAERLRRFVAPVEAAGLRLDAYLAQALPDISRARVQMLIGAGQVLVEGAAPKAKAKLRGGEQIEIHGEPVPEPLHATPEDIPLAIVYEDRWLAVIDKPAGMMVHAGAGAASEGGDPAEPDPRSSGTLVNALLFHLRQLSAVGGELRPGIVHRLDKQTSGVILVAKDDSTHRRLGEMFAAREVHKTYLALAHGRLAKDDTTVTLAIARDAIRRTRMTTRRSAETARARSAVSHVHVLERLQTAYGAFTLVEVTIETGRTHQIRVHLQALGHPVVGDTLYGAPQTMRPVPLPGGRTTVAAKSDLPPLTLERNFLHAARLALTHPQTGQAIEFEAPLPPELVTLLETLRASPASTPTGRTPRASNPRDQVESTG